MVSAGFKLAAVIDSPIGRLAVHTDGGRIAAIELGDAAVPLCQPADAIAVRAVRQIQSYFDHPDTAFQLPLVPRGTPFQRRVWEVLSRIPAGRARTYGEIARELGTSARAVGAACRANPLPILVPCHRVVAADGLGGYSGNRGGRWLESKRWLLAHEGALPG
jgi:methylated-DNA-[protein]-cysteine S-methyltransferase